MEAKFPVKINPRSYADIRKAVREGRLKTRGEVMNAVIEGFREPINERKASTKKKKETSREQEPTQKPEVKKTVTKPKTTTKE